jgi:hypothetical protein
LALIVQLIQRRNPGKEAFSTHFVLRLALAIAILASGLWVSPVLRRIYADQVVVADVFLVLLVINVLTASFSTPGAVLRRDMRFGAIAFLNLLSSLAMTITAPLLEANRAEIDYISVTPNTAYLEAKLDQIMPQARIYTGDGFIICTLANQGD